MALHLPKNDPDLSLNGFVVAVFVVVVVNLVFWSTSWPFSS